MRRPVPIYTPVDPRLVSNPNLGLTTEQVVAKFYSNLNRWPVDPDGSNWTQSQILAVCEHIAKTGDSLWHAQSVVVGFPNCPCAKCMGGGR